MKKILFIGAFLSGKRKTVSVAEKFSVLISEYYNVNLVSKKENKVLRLSEIIWALLFQKYDYIHINIYSGQSFKIVEITTFIAKLRNKKIVMALQGGALIEFFMQDKKRIKKVFNSANMIYSPSYYLLNFFKNEGFSVDYLPNFVNLKNFPYNRDNVQKNTLLWVRSFGENYNPQLAVKTLKILTKEFTDISMTMIGPDGGNKSEVEQLIEDLNLSDRITLLGSVLNNELYRYFQTHSVYLNTTKYESFGLALVEAASCGIPIVSTNVGEIPYMWDNNKNIMLIDSPDETIMADKVKILLNSDKNMNQFSIEGNKNILRYDWNILKDEWLKMLKKLED